MTQQITIKCIRDAGDKEAEPITDSMITTEPLAVACGTPFLDDPDQGGYSRGVQHTLRVPHKSNAVVPGTWVTIDCPRLNLYEQIAKVLSYTITFDGSSFYGNMTVERYEKNELV